MDEPFAGTKSFSGLQRPDHAWVAMASGLLHIFELGAEVGAVTGEARRGLPVGRKLEPPPARKMAGR
jgi:hypothetical protein